MPENKLEGQNAAVARGAIEGALSGSAIVVPTWYLLNRRWPAFRALPTTMKTLGAVIIIVPLISIRAEHRGLDFHRQHWYVGRFVLRHCLTWTGLGRVLERRSWRRSERRSRGGGLR